jgi:hypothetical protein
LGGRNVVEENNVEMVLRFSKEKGVEELGIGGVALVFL